ncbi:MAG: ATP-binding protein [Thermodesulfobacteriota bacterium]
MSETNAEILRLIALSRDKFRSLVDGLEDEVMSIDRDFRLVSVNQALSRRLDQHPRQAVGQFCFNWLYGFTRPCPENGLACPALTARSSRRVEITHHELPLEAPAPVESLQVERGVKERFIEIRAMPVLDESGAEPDEIILVRRDVTLTRQAEINLLEYNERLEREVRARTLELSRANEDLSRQRNELVQANDELLKLQTLKEDLTNMVVHDLKGPLSEIQANLEMMAAEPLGVFQAELLEAARLGGFDLQRMITNVLDVSRLEENRLVLDFEPFVAGEMIQEALRRFTPLARLSEVTLAAEAANDLPPLVADKRLFERILNNLISNALDYTPISGRVTVRSAADPAGFRFEVEDTGRGIPPELQGKIFEKFSQGQARGRPKTSTGLGLTFCRMAVEAHGGGIRVESEPGRGSRFIFVLPFRDMAVPEAGAENV